MISKFNQNSELSMMIILFIFAFIMWNSFSNFNFENFEFNSVPNTTSKISKSKSYNLGVCSKNCCATQWPTNININERSKVNLSQIGKEYSTSNLTCNNGIINGGCVCLTKESKKLLENKGNVRQLPLGNGLLDEDNRTGVFQLSDNLIDKPAVLGQTNQLTGMKIEFDDITGLLKNSSKFSDISLEQGMMENKAIPINNNFITWDNEEINNKLEDRLFTSDSSKMDRLMNNRIGLSTTDKNKK